MTATGRLMPATVADRREMKARPISYSWDFSVTQGGVPLCVLRVSHRRELEGAFFEWNGDDFEIETTTIGSGLFGRAKGYRLTRNGTKLCGATCYGFDPLVVFEIDGHRYDLFHANTLRNFFDEAFVLKTDTTDDRVAVGTMARARFSWWTDVALSNDLSTPAQIFVLGVVLLKGQRADD